MEGKLDMGLQFLAATIWFTACLVLALVSG